MAERRMFAKSIIFNDHFGSLPLQAQLLYFNLSLEGDDDGFLNNAWFVQRMIGATADDMQALIDGGYLIRFDSGVVAIRHWRVNNSIKSDRYKPTMYQAERAQLTLKNGAYEWNTPAPPKPAEKDNAKCSPVRNDDDLLPSAAQPANASPYRPAQADDCPAYQPVRNDDNFPYSAPPMADNSPYRPAQAEDCPAYQPVRNDDDFPYSALPTADNSPYRPAQAEDCPVYQPVRNDDDPPYDALPMADNSPYRPAQADDYLEYQPVRNDDNIPYSAPPMADNSPYRPAQAEDCAAYQPVRNDDDLPYHPAPNTSQPSPMNAYWPIPPTESRPKSREAPAKTPELARNPPGTHVEPFWNPRLG